MPYVMVHNRSAIEDQMVLLARFLDLKSSGHTAVLDWVLELRSEL